MLTIILIMFCGIILGRLLRSKSLPFSGTLTNVFIWILLFLLGVEVGNDERIVKGMASLGFEAIIMAVAGVAGSGLLSLCLWKLCRKTSKTSD